MNYGCSGHIDLTRIKNFSEKNVRQKIGRVFSLSADARLFCGMADGADKLFFDEAIQKNIPVVAVLPKPVEAYADEHADRDGFLRDLQKAEKVVVSDGYCAATDYILSACQKLLVLWDGKELPFLDENGAPVNLGGTYYAVVTAKRKGLPVLFI